MALSLQALVLAIGATSVASWVYESNMNAVNGCGMACKDNHPYVCLGTVSSFQDCVAACATDSTCEIMTWSSSTGNCWTRVSALYSQQVPTPNIYLHLLLFLPCRPTAYGTLHQRVVHRLAATMRPLLAAHHHSPGMVPLSLQQSVRLLLVQQTCVPQLL